MLVGLVPFGLTQCYAGTLRESGQTVLPMKASMLAMVVNFIFNALLIFGLGPFPGWAWPVRPSPPCFPALWSWPSSRPAHRSADRYPFMRGVYHSLAIPGVLVKSIFIRSMPLLANELMWGAGQAVLLQCYSVRGIQAVAALNICNTIAQIFNEVFLSLGNATAIVVGQELGADRLTGARRTAWRMITLSLASCVIMGAALAVYCALYPPHLQHRGPIRLFATELIRMAALCMPLYGFANCEYFTLRSGGKTFITFCLTAALPGLYPCRWPTACPASAG